MSKSMTELKIMDWILIGITFYVLMRTCGGDKLLFPESPTVMEPDVPIVQPTDSPPLDAPLVDEEVLPEGLVDNFAQADPSCKEGGMYTNADGVMLPCGVTENFGQETGTPAPAACPPSLIYTERALTKSNSDLSSDVDPCWAGDNAVTSECIQGGAAKVANFYDAAQTNTVVEAIGRDPSRDTIIRQAPATANYDLRQSPKIKFNGFPSYSFVGGNLNTGLPGTD